MLSEHLIQHFHGLARETGRRASRRRIGEAMTKENVAAFFDEQGIDQNGIDPLGKNYLLYLNRNGATAEERLRQDFYDLGDEDLRPNDVKSGVKNPAFRASESRYLAFRLSKWSSAPSGGRSG
jgi:hypothetical protein